MATKLQLVSELAHKTAMDVTRDPEIWMRFLDTASRMYKYSFDDQILRSCIHKVLDIRCDKWYDTKKHHIVHKFCQCLQTMLSG